MNDELIYLDNAATTFPKPREVLRRMVERYSELGVSPGRGTYDLAVEAEQHVMDTRKQLCQLFGAEDPHRVVFAANATDALNLAIQGLLKPGDHVVTTRLEHNSVLRPLSHLKQRKWIDFTLVPFDPDGVIDPDEIRQAILPNTKLVIMTHASNVLGTIQPVAEVGQICAEAGVPLLLDVAQSAGLVPIEMSTWQVSAIAFTGHKGLLGPSGIGGLVVSPGLDVQSTRFGGTGIDSRSLTHTQSFPHRLEAGTLNLMGILGLAESLKFLQKEGLSARYQREMALFERLRQGLACLDQVTIYSPARNHHMVPIVTCTIEDLDPTDVGSILDGDFGIAVRTGLHCAPLVHADLGTAERGAVRFSLGYANTEDDVDAALEAVASLCP